MVGEDDFRDQTDVIIRIVADYAQLEVAIAELRRNLTRQAATYLNLYLWIDPAIISMCCRR